MKINAFILATPEIKFPPSLSFEFLRKAELLVGKSHSSENENMALVLQFEDGIWTVPQPLQPQGQTGNVPTVEAVPLFDIRREQMLKRYMIRDPSNQDFIFCAARESNSHKIYRVELVAGTKGNVQAKEFYTLTSGQIVFMEIDTESDDGSIIVVSDYQKVLRIQGDDNDKTQV